MNLDFSEFISGFNDQLSKVGENESSIFDIHGAMFPTISAQSKWSFARGDNHLHLHDGSNVFAFHLPEGEQDYDFPAAKLDNVAVTDFGKDSTTGVAQVHRSDPGSIYFTLQDGNKNPTYTFKHVGGSQWRATPKHATKVKPIEIDKEAFIKAATDYAEKGPIATVLDNILKGTDSAGRGMIRGGMALGHDPVLSAGAGLLGGAMYDVGKRTFYNSEEENAEETRMDRLKRYLIPALGLGVAGSAAKGLFPNYYSEFPAYRP